MNNALLEVIERIRSDIGDRLWRYDNKSLRALETHAHCEFPDEYKTVMRELGAGVVGNVEIMRPDTVLALIESNGELLSDIRHLLVARDFVRGRGFATPLSGSAAGKVVPAQPGPTWGEYSYVEEQAIEWEQFLRHECYRAV